MGERRWSGSRIMLYLLACIGLAVGGYQLRQTEQQVQRLPARVGDVPVVVLAPRAAGAHPAIVLAHGYAACKQYMYTLAYALAQHGYTAVVFDFSGHGQNPTPFDSDWQRQSADSPLAADLAAVVAYARTLPQVDATRVALLGYSMGSAIASRYAQAHDDIAATVAVSTIYSDVSPGSPRNLLLLTGAWEFTRLHDAAWRALAAAGGSAAGRTYGDFAAGTASRLVLVPGVEHSAIPFSGVTQREVVSWLDAVFGRAGTAGPPDRRLLWVGLIALCALVLFAPLAALLLGDRYEREEPSPLEIGGVLLVTVVPAAVVPLLLRVLPYQFIPLLGGDYIAAFVFLQGVFMIALLLVLGAWSGERMGRLLSLGTALGALALFIYLGATLGLTAQHTLLNVWPIPRRLGIIGVVCALMLPYFVASEYVSRTSYPGYNQLFPLIVKGAFLLSLAGAVWWLGAPYVLLLMVPALALFAVLSEWLGRVIYRFSGNPGISGILLALLYAWTIGTLFPLAA